MEKLLVATSKFGLLTIRRHSATRKHIFPYPQADRSGLRKPKKYKHQHESQLPPAFIPPKPVSIDLTIKSDSVSRFRFRFSFKILNVTLNQAYNRI